MQVHILKENILETEVYVNTSLAELSSSVDYEPLMTFFLAYHPITTNTHLLPGIPVYGMFEATAQGNGTTPIILHI